MRVELQGEDEIISLLGVGHSHARTIRKEMGLSLGGDKDGVTIQGEEGKVFQLRTRLVEVLESIRSASPPGPKGVLRALLGPPLLEKGIVIRGRSFSPVSGGQWDYLRAMQEHPLTLVTGPAGTGKTFLAAAWGCQQLHEGRVDRLILCRPVVEAGENLGYLPGDVEAKVAPYFRPLHDALVKTLGHPRTRRLTQGGQIEIAPLAYMRGRTLENAFLILDEAQNTTVGQMKMVLTRMGQGAIVVVTGDPSQCDLPKSEENGLRVALSRLKGVEGVASLTLGRRDIVRHPLVARIDRAFEDRA